ncbi:hypothetical protein C6N75_17070 [Streptomyces solincola]|uniref:Transcriptional regulator n=1 Tax=Streptomyces solincola TaxID=2100817 RepID=A0A2S9PUF5_9ACTN|nr:hypothetical protein [Streptomyces solincola]PRH78044.1 hypothetical protein C6N75_17070 [Streptomyces solincola]
MPLTVGVIGPDDLVTKVLAVGRPGAADGGAGGGGTGPVRLLPLAYRHEDETAERVARARAEADALLFTGVVPYARAEADGLLDRPAMYVPYHGATLLRALVELLKLGHDVSRVSVDTLRREEVLETMTEAKLPTDRVRVLPHRPGLTSEQIVDFHLAAARDGGARVAVTCLGSAHRALEHRTHTVRLAPSRHSIRAVLRALAPAAASRRDGDARVALGIVELPGGAGLGPDEVRALGGSLAGLPDGRALVVTTRGALESATSGFTRMPFLQAAARHGGAHAGFGLGRTAAEAEALARRAVGRARAAGPVAGVVSLAGDVDVVIAPDGGAPAGGAADDPALLAHRAGLRPGTLDRLRELSRGREDEGLTTRLVAEHLAVEQRTARRILKRLERAGVAEPAVVAAGTGRTGRPPLVYRVRL